MHPESGFRIAPNWSTNQKNDNDAIICRHDVIVKFFWRRFFFLSILVTGPSFMSISSLVLNFWLFYKGLIRNLEFGNTSVWVLPNIWRLGRVGDTKVCTIISNKMLLNAVKILFEERSHIFRATVTMVVADNLVSSTLSRFFYNFSTVKNVICFYNFLK